MSKKFLVVAIGVFALALVAAGCGGGDDTSDGGEALTKTEFVKQADAICEQGNATIEEEVEAFAEDNDVDIEKPSKEQQEEVIADVVAPATQQQLDEIGELGAPEGDEDQIETMLETTEGGVSELEDDPALLLEGKNPLSAGSKLAKEYGLKSCGEE